VLQELGNTGSAISEYKRLLRQHPHDTTILRLLAEAYIDKDDVEAAKEFYRESISFYRVSDESPGHVFGWSDINIYVELCAYRGQYDVAIKELKSLSRWVLGRQQDSWWDLIVEDDREWDANDSRRIHIREFVTGRYNPQLYGEGLPLELRVKLGLYRLRLGNYDEAMVCVTRNRDFDRYLCLLTPS
jgi:general transcription factor 3C polypeptide 3 (transcription factor C subunit 4)